VGFFAEKYIIFGETFWSLRYFGHNCLPVVLKLAVLPVLFFKRSVVFLFHLLGCFWPCSGKTCSGKKRQCLFCRQDGSKRLGRKEV